MRTKWKIFMCVLLLCGGCVMAEKSLKRAYSGDFEIGAAVAGRYVLNSADENSKKAVRLLERDFSCVTAENMMKPESLRPAPGQFNFERADQFVTLAKSLDLEVVGHVLVWHSQTPNWFFEHEDGSPLTREELIERMREHIHTVVKHYKGDVKYWDVVNEAVDVRDGQGFFRTSKWQQIIGDDFIELAFKFAHEADPDAILIYNDYSMTDQAKVDFVVEHIVRPLKEKGIQIDAVGMQGHWHVDSPSLNEIETSIEKLAAADVKVHITELDMSVLPQAWGYTGADISTRFELQDELNPYQDGAPEEVLAQQAQRYREIFDLFESHKADVARVTFWGISDGDSWKNGFPVRGRTDYPLLFDRNYEPKPAYEALMPSQRNGANAIATEPLPIEKKGGNPIVSNRYLADPSVLVTKERVYVYCSNDDESPLEGGYNIPSVVCVSSSDMKNWTDHGVVFDAARDTTWARKTWAPCAIERDGKFFLYFGNGGGNIGVVSSDSPVGPFKDEKGTHLIDGNTPGVQPFQGGWLFDPGVFIDDDGQAYIYFGGNGDDKARIGKLKKDMMTIDGEIMKMNIPNFFEAIWVWKLKGTYYLSYSTTPNAGMRIDYMTSKNPTNGFEYAGIVADQPPINNNNNHACEFQFKGKWYHVYHNRIVAKNAGIPGAYRRNIAVEEFRYDEAGAIEKVKYTSNGVEQIESVNPYRRVEAETFAAQNGIETVSDKKGGMYVADTQHGDWIKIAGVDFGEKGASKVGLRVAAESKKCRIKLRLDSLDGTVIADCSIPATGGAQKWKNIACDVRNATGIHNLYLTFEGAEGDLATLDWWTFSPKE